MAVTREKFIEPYRQGVEMRGEAYDRERRAILAALDDKIARLDGAVRALREARAHFVAATTQMETPPPGATARHDGSD